MLSVGIYIDLFINIFLEVAMSTPTGSLDQETKHPETAKALSFGQETHGGDPTERNASSPSASGRVEPWPSSSAAKRWHARTAKMESPDSSIARPHRIGAWNVEMSPCGKKPSHSKSMMWVFPIRLHVDKASLPIPLGPSCPACCFYFHISPPSLVPRSPRSVAKPAGSSGRTADRRFLQWLCHCRSCPASSPNSLALHQPLGTLHAWWPCLGIVRPHNLRESKDLAMKRIHIGSWFICAAKKFPSAGWGFHEISSPWVISTTNRKPGRIHMLFTCIHGLCSIDCWTCWVRYILTMLENSMNCVWSSNNPYWLTLIYWFMTIPIHLLVILWSSRLLIHGFIWWYLSEMVW